MRVFVAFTAFLRGFCEIRMAHRQFQIWWPVAFCARHGPVRSYKRESRRVVIELRQILPLPRRVARLTAQGFPFPIVHYHSFCKLPVMHILVTSRATQLTEVIQDYLGAVRCPVTPDAGNRDVTSGQWEVGLLVQCE